MRKTPLRLELPGPFNSQVLVILKNELFKIVAVRISPESPEISLEEENSLHGNGFPKWKPIPFYDVSRLIACQRTPYPLRGEGPLPKERMVFKPSSVKYETRLEETGP